MLTASRRSPSAARSVGRPGSGTAKPARPDRGSRPTAELAAMSSAATVAATAVPQYEPERERAEDDAGDDQGDRRAPGDRVVARRRRGEGRILREHPGLQLAKLAARLQPELLDAVPASLAVSLERVGPAPAAVQGEHQLAAQPLAQRVGLHERSKVGHHSATPGRAPGRRRPALQRHRPQRVEPSVSLGERR